ncbi:unnamed protein product [Symbiodinium necroappetens]|uniref:Uncharacterized protein n=1 Tax=Symbiodinium necroappetens TaxID=1628268 RepID=A0A812MRK6_9DINO|nr:unnamed protein product [Symbiodinium necroappetens]
MPPKGSAASKKHFRSLAVDDQIALLNQRADSLLQKQQLRLISDVLKEQPELILGVVKHLESKGVQFQKLASFGKSKPAAEESTEGLEAKQTTVDEDDENKGTGGRPPKVRKTSEVQDPDPKNWIPHAYTRLDNTRAPILEDILASIHEISFSPFMLKALRPKGSKAADYQIKLQELLEFSTGFDVAKPLVGDLRHIPTLKKTLIDMSQQTGRRGNALKLPPDWTGKDGIYELSSDEDGVVSVRHRYAKITVKVPTTMHFTDDSGDLIDVEDLVVDKNYSQDKAVITWSGSPESVLIASLPWPADVKSTAEPNEKSKMQPETALVASSPEKPQLRRKPSTLSLGPSDEGKSQETSPMKA